MVPFNPQTSGHGCSSPAMVSLWHFMGSKSIQSVRPDLCKVRTWAGRAYTDDELSRRFENQSSGQVQDVAFRRFGGLPRTCNFWDMINHMDHRICWDVLGFIVMFGCPIFGQPMRCLHGHVVSVQSLGKICLTLSQPGNEGLMDEEAARRLVARESGPLRFVFRDCLNLSHSRHAAPTALKLQKL